MKYPNGIDQAEGCTSVPLLIKKEDEGIKNHNKLLARRREMAAEYGFIETKETAIKKQKELYLLNKKLEEEQKQAELERVNAYMNAKKERREKNKKMNEKFHKHVSVGSNAAASATSASHSTGFNINTLIGCKEGQSIGDKLFADREKKAASGRKGLGY